MFPVFFEYSRVPRLIGMVAPIKPYAVSFGFWVWCSGRIDDKLRRHETIHYKQQLELVFVFHWVLYLLFWLVLFARFRDGQVAYRRNPFEMEAFGNEAYESYLRSRPAFGWVRYVVRCWSWPSDF